MQPELLILVVSTIGTAIWSVLTWAEQEEKERKSEEDQLDTLYVNPFLNAAEELQMLLYNLLVGNEIEFLRTGITHRARERADEISYNEALEIVHPFAKFFGWSICFNRYGSYSQDKNAILMARQISLMFADREQFGDDPFRFSLTKQHGLGRQFVQRISSVAGEEMQEYSAVTLYDFCEKIMKNKKEGGSLFDDISLLIDTIRSTPTSKDLPGRARLSTIQNQLVDLINYIESKEKFTLTNEVRKKTRLVGDEIIVEIFPAIPSNESWSPLLTIPALFSPIIPLVQNREETEQAQIIHTTDGRVRLKIPQISNDASYAGKLVSWVENIPGVKSVQTNSRASSLTIHYNPEIYDNIPSLLLREINNGITFPSLIS